MFVQGLIKRIFRLILAQSLFASTLPMGMMTFSLGVSSKAHAEEPTERDLIQYAASLGIVLQTSTEVDPNDATKTVTQTTWHLPEVADLDAKVEVFAAAIEAQYHLDTSSLSEAQKSYTLRIVGQAAQEGSDYATYAQWINEGTLRQNLREALVREAASQTEPQNAEELEASRAGRNFTLPIRLLDSTTRALRNVANSAVGFGLENVHLFGGNFGPQMPRFKRTLTFIRGIAHFGVQVYSLHFYGQHFPATEAIVYSWATTLATATLVSALSQSFQIYSMQVGQFMTQPGFINFRALGIDRDVLRRQGLVGIYNSLSRANARAVEQTLIDRGHGDMVAVIRRHVKPDGTVDFNAITESEVGAKLRDRWGAFTPLARKIVNAIENTNRMELRAQGRNGRHNRLILSAYDGVRDRVNREESPIGKMYKYWLTEVFAFVGIIGGAQEIFAHLAGDPVTFSFIGFATDVTVYAGLGVIAQGSIENLIYTWRNYEEKKILNDRTLNATQKADKIARMQRAADVWIAINSVGSASLVLIGALMNLAWITPTLVAIGTPALILSTRLQAKSFRVMPRVGYETFMTQFVRGGNYFSTLLAQRPARTPMTQRLEEANRAALTGLSQYQMRRAATLRANVVERADDKTLEIRNELMSQGYTAEQINGWVNNPMFGRDRTIPPYNILVSILRLKNLNRQSEVFSTYAQSLEGSARSDEVIDRAFRRRASSICLGQFKPAS